MTIRPLMRPLLALSTVILSAGCEPNRTVTVEQNRPQDPLLAKFAGNYNLQRGGDGSLQANSDKRSQFEGRSFRDGKGGQSALGNQQYRTNQYRAKESNLPREYRRAGETYATPNAREQQQEYRRAGDRFATAPARDSGRRYQAGAFETGQARENSEAYATSTYRDSTERRNYRVDDVSNIRTPDDNRAPIRLQDVRKSLGKP